MFACWLWLQLPRCSTTVLQWSSNSAIPTTHTVHIQTRGKVPCHTIPYDRTGCHSSKTSLYFFGVCAATKWKTNTTCNSLKYILSLIAQNTIPITNHSMHIISLPRSLIFNIYIQGWMLEKTRSILFTRPGRPDFGIGVWNTEIQESGCQSFEHSLWTDT